VLYEDMGGQGSGTRERGGWYGQRAGYKQGNIDTRPRRYDCIFLFSAFSWVLERGGLPSTGCPGWEMGFQASRNSLFLDENEKKWNWCFSCFRFVFLFFKADRVSEGLPLTWRHWRLRRLLPPSPWRLGRRMGRWRLLGWL